MGSDDTKQPVSTVTVDPQLKSGQKTLAERTTPQQQPATTNGAANQTGGAKTKHNVLLSDAATAATPAYPGAKHDVRGFCIRHSRWRMSRPLVGEEGGSDPNNYRTVRKVCPVCGEQSLVKKERTTPSHGFNPYAKRETREEQHDTKLFTKRVPKSKSQGKAPHFVRKRLHHVNSAGATAASVEKNVVKERHKASDVGGRGSNNHKSSAKVESDESLQRRRSHSGPIRGEGTMQPDKKVPLQKQQNKGAVNKKEHTKQSGERQEKKDGLQRQKSQNDRQEEKQDQKNTAVDEPAKEGGASYDWKESTGQHDKRDGSLQRQKGLGADRQEEKKDENHKLLQDKDEVQRRKSPDRVSLQDKKADPLQRQKSESADRQQGKKTEDRAPRQDKDDGSLQRQKSNRQQGNKTEDRVPQDKDDGSLQRQKSQSANRQQGSKSEDRVPQDKDDGSLQRQKTQRSECQESSKSEDRVPRQEKTEDNERQKSQSEDDDRGSQQDMKEDSLKQKRKNATCRKVNENGSGSQQDKKEQAPRPKNKSAKAKNDEGSLKDKKDDVPKHKENRDEIQRQKCHTQRKTAELNLEKKDGQKSQSAVLQEEAKEKELEPMQEMKVTANKPQGSEAMQSSTDGPPVRKCIDAERTSVGTNDEMPQLKSKSAVRQVGRKEEECHDEGGRHEKKVAFHRQKSRDVGTNVEHKSKSKSSRQSHQKLSETAPEAEPNPLKRSNTEKNSEMKHPKAFFKKELKVSHKGPNSSELKRSSSKGHNQKSPNRSLEKSEAVVVTSRNQHLVEKKSHSKKHDVSTKKTSDPISDSKESTNHMLAHVTRKARGRSLSPQRTPRRVKSIDAKIEEGKNDPTRIKQRSKSVGHTIRTQRQRIGSEFHYIYRPPMIFLPAAPAAVPAAAPAPAAPTSAPAAIPEMTAASPAPIATMSAYREAFYEEICNHSCVKSLLDHP